MRKAGGGTLLALATALTLYGCAQPVAHLLSYELISEERAIDPITGDIVITSLWRYSDDYHTATFKRIPRGNEVRRTDHPATPPARLAD